LHLRGGRSVIRNAAPYKCACAQQFNSNLSRPADKCVPRGIRYKLAHDQAQAPAPERFQWQRRGRNRELYMRMIELRSADRQAQLVKVSAHVQEGLLMRELQSMVDLCIVVQELRNRPQGAFDFSVCGTGRGVGYDTDDGGKLIIDPVIEFLEEQSFIRRWGVQARFRHNVLLLRSKVFLLIKAAVFGWRFSLHAANARCRASVTRKIRVSVGFACAQVLDPAQASLPAKGTRKSFHNGCVIRPATAGRLLEHHDQWDRREGYDRQQLEIIYVGNDLSLLRDHGIERGAPCIGQWIPELCVGRIFEPAIDGRDVCNNIGVVGLRVLREQAHHHGYADAGADIARKIVEAGAFRPLLRRQRRQGRRTERHEEKSQTGALDQAIDDDRGL
jgi:hypothetical protein